MFAQSASVCCLPRHLTLIEEWREAKETDFPSVFNTSAPNLHNVGLLYARPNGNA